MIVFRSAAPIRIGDYNPLGTVKISGSRGFRCCRDSPLGYCVPVSTMWASGLASVAYTWVVMQALRIVPFVFLVLGLVSCSASDPSERAVASQRAVTPVSELFFEDKVPLTKPPCTDVLSTWKKKPENLFFLGCSDGTNAQIDTLEYRYSVAGANAKPVEKFLIDTYSMAPLAFVCCGWEPRPVEGSTSRLGVFRNEEGFYYEIAMGSGESVEKDWSKIPTFHVTVELFLDLV